VLRRLLGLGLESLRSSPCLVQAVVLLLDLVSFLDAQQVGLAACCFWHHHFVAHEIHHRIVIVQSSESHILLLHVMRYHLLHRWSMDNVAIHQHRLVAMSSDHMLSMHLLEILLLRNLKFCLVLKHHVTLRRLHHVNLSKSKPRCLCISHAPSLVLLHLIEHLLLELCLRVHEIPLVSKV